MTQIRHAVYNPDGLEKSENCGPASLAMAALYLGRKVPAIPGLPEPSDPQSYIDATRFWMFADPSGRTVCSRKDGVEFTSVGVRRAPEEHLTLVNLPDLERGAANLSLLPQRLKDWREIDAALAGGRPVALAGDPSLPGAYGSRLFLNYSGGHVILLLAQGDRGYLANDPLVLSGPCRLLTEELEAFSVAAPFEETLALSFSL